MKQPNCSFGHIKKKKQRICTFFRLLCTNIPLPHLLTVQICVAWNQNRAVFQTQVAGSSWIFCWSMLGHVDSSKLSTQKQLILMNMSLWQ